MAANVTSMPMITCMVWTVSLARWCSGSHGRTVRPTQALAHSSTKTITADRTSDMVVMLCARSWSASLRRDHLKVVGLRRARAGRGGTGAGVLRQEVMLVLVG